MTERVPEGLWMEVCNIVQNLVSKAILKGGKNAKRQNGCKASSEEALQIAEKRREVKGKGEKERYIHLNAEFQRTARRERKLSSVINANK